MLLHARDMCHTRVYILPHCMTYTIMPATRCSLRCAFGIYIVLRQLMTIIIFSSRAPGHGASISPWPLMLPSRARAIFFSGRLPDATDCSQPDSHLGLGRAFFTAARRRRKRHYFATARLRGEVLMPRVDAVNVAARSFLMGAMRFHRWHGFTRRATAAPSA